MLASFLAHVGVLTALLGAWGNAEIHCHSVNPPIYGFALPGHAYIRSDLCRALWQSEPRARASAIHTLTHELAHTRGYWRECVAENRTMRTWRFVARRLGLTVFARYIWEQHYRLPALYHKC